MDDKPDLTHLTGDVLQYVADLEAENARLRAAVDATLEWCDLNPEWYAWVVAENLRTALEGGEP